MQGVEDRPFRGMTVLDLSQGMAGPGCGMQFALRGADVIKVEPPDGDWVRALGRTYGDNSAVSLSANRGKRSIALDLKAEAGLGILQRLVRTADILIESNRVGASERLGIAYEQLRPLNPRLIHVSITGFGSTGPYAQETATDTVAQAFSGIMSHTRDQDGRPTKTGFLIVDAVAALTVFGAATSALFARERDGEGRHVEVSLLDACAGVQAYKLVEQCLEGGGAQPLNVPAGNYRASDGWISLSLMRERHFEAICRVVGLPGLASEPRFATFAARANHADEIVQLLSGRIAERPAAEWIASFRDADVLCSRVNDLRDWMADPHVQAVGAAVAIDHPGIGRYHVPRVAGVSGPQPVAHAPALGGDTDDILADLGLSAAEIGELVAAGTVRRPSPDRPDRSP